MTASSNAKKTDVAIEKKETKLGIEAEKTKDFSGWYTQVLLRSEMIDYYDVSGCYILRPWSFKIWKQIQSFFGGEIEKLGVEDAYFPLFISQGALQREKEHVEGFAPEVAWVTKSGQSELAEPVAVRPTSETAMYPAYAKWIQSHRDLPLRLNQWCNVVRWEFKHPQPFIRSREFLWQEGHTVFNTKAEADQEVLQILDLYRQVYEDLLAVPVIKGVKSENEKFAGALYTTTVEAFIPTAGRGVQGATSHCLGQNFSKMFKIAVEGKNGEPEYAWQNSWGLTTRSLGVMIMVHSDNNGLVLPPRVASLQVVVIPVGITAKLGEEAEKAIYDAVEKIVQRLKAVGIRAHADCRDNYTPGWKFNHWELKGVPLRFEVGPRDLSANEVRVVMRHDGSKKQLSQNNIEALTKDMLNEIHQSMFEKAKKDRDAQLKVVESWDEFMSALENKCIIMAPWCENGPCEGEIKEKSSVKTTVVADGIDGQQDSRAPSMGAKTLCIPFDQPGKCEGKTCVGCNLPAKRYALFGRSY